MSLHLRALHLRVDPEKGTSADMAHALTRAGRKRDVDYVTATLRLAHMVAEVKVSDRGQAFTVTNLNPPRRYNTSADGVEKAFADVVRELYPDDSEALDQYGRLVQGQ